ncbi:CHASE2 domain-containing protein [Verrucomicrobiota bacterium]
MNWKSLAINAAILTVILAAVLPASNLPLMRKANRGIHDIWFRVRGAIAVSPELTLVCIENDSLATLGQWPWSRDIHALLIGSLKQSGAGTVALDILFSDPGNDDAIIAVTRAASNVVHTASFLKERIVGLQADEEDLQALERFCFDTEKLAIPVWEAREALLPIRDLLEVSAGLGHSNAEPDFDGNTRRLPLFVDYDGCAVPALGLTMAMMHLGIGDRDIKINTDGVILTTPNGKTIRIPVDRHGCALVNYPGPLELFDSHTYVDVVRAAKEDAKASLENFDGKLVLVGMTAEGSTDLRPTPYSPLTPMMCVHAALANGILTNNLLAKVGMRSQVAVVAAAFLILLVAFSYPRPIVGTAACIAVFMALAAGGYFVFVSKGLLFDAAPAAALTLVGGITLLVKNALLLDQKRRMVDGIIQRYVSGNILQKVYEDPDLLKIGGVRQELTIFFSDCRGFTSLCDRTEPEFIVGILNEYLKEMIRIVHEFGGTLDKIRGDGFMAFFGNPVPQEDHALRAVRMAIAMQAAVSKMQESWTDQGLEGLAVGMGINTGWVTVGNIGSERHSEYTVVGNNVNLAARVESVSKGGQILLTRRTYSLVRDRIEARALEPVKLKGIPEPVQVYEVTGEKKISDETQEQHNAQETETSSEST